MTGSKEKRVLLTGGTGLIGSQVPEALQSHGFDVYGLTIDRDNPDSGVHWIKGDVFDAACIDAIFNEVKPQYLLNLAWCARDDYLTSNLNYQFRDAGISLLKLFAKHGGRRAVYAGTCFEYAFKNTPLKEDDALDPQSVYANCKNELCLVASQFAMESGLSFGWGRIFYVYGKNEHPTRLTASIINSLKQNEKVCVRTSQLKKDYLYTKDIAGAFAAFLDSSVEGVVNICSGKALSLKEYATAIARQMNKCELLECATEPTSQPPIIVGDNARLLREVGYLPRYDLETAIKEILA